MASGSFAAACTSASTKVSGVGASGVVGVVGASPEVTGGSTAVEVKVSAGLSSASTRSASLTSFWSEVIRLLPAKPEAASLTSSKLFLRSAISASRIASWNWPWNSAAILRALPIHCPTMRSTPGSSFGPMAIRATTPIRTSSLPPMSNMRSSVHASRSRPNPSRAGSGPLPASRVLSGSDGLAADVGSGRGRRGIVFEGLRRLRLVGDLVVVLHTLFEGLDALRHVAHQIRNLAAAEQQQDHCDHQDPVPNAKRTHPATLQTRLAGVPADLHGNLGFAGVKNKDQG